MMIHEQDGYADAQELTSADLTEENPDTPPTEEEFAEEVRDLVASSVPRVFALVEEHGERLDGRILHWGLVFDEDDHAILINADSHLHGGSFSSAESAQQIFSRRKKIRLVWTSTPATHLAENPAC